MKFGNINALDTVNKCNKKTESEESMEGKQKANQQKSKNKADNWAKEN